MIEAAIRELAAEDPKFGPPVSDQPAEGPKPKDKDERVEEGEVLDDDSEVILVDENNGASVNMPKRNLKEEAVSMARLISHRFKNPHCQACARGKTRHLYTRKGGFQGGAQRMGGCCYATLSFRVSR